MVVGEGVREIPDSEDEPLTSSPQVASNGAVDKLSPIVRGPFQDASQDVACTHQESGEVSSSTGSKRFKRDERLDVDHQNASIDVDPSEQVARADPQANASPWQDLAMRSSAVEDECSQISSQPPVVTVGESEHAPALLSQPALSVGGVSGQDSSAAEKQSTSVHNSIHTNPDDEQATDGIFKGKLHLDENLFESAAHADPRRSPCQEPTPNSAQGEVTRGGMSESLQRVSPSEISNDELDPSTQLTNSTILLESTRAPNNLVKESATPWTSTQSLAQSQVEKRPTIIKDTSTAHVNEKSSTNEFDEPEQLKATYQSPDEHQPTSSITSTTEAETTTSTEYPEPKSSVNIIAIQGSNDLDFLAQGSSQRSPVQNLGSSRLSPTLKASALLNEDIGSSECNAKSGNIAADLVPTNGKDQTTNPHITCLPSLRGQSGELSSTYILSESACSSEQDTPVTAVLSELPQVSVESPHRNIDSEKDQAEHAPVITNVEAHDSEMRAEKSMEKTQQKDFGARTSETAGPSNNVEKGIESEPPTPQLVMNSKQPAKAMTPQETTLAELKAQRTALLASLAALPDIRDLIAEHESADAATQSSESQPTDTQVTAAANKIVKKHIKLLHQYNELKDVGQGLMGLIADQRGVRIVEVQEEFGIDSKD